MYGCIQTVLSDPHEGNVRREGKLCRRSASRKMSLLTAHCVASSVRVPRRVRFPSSASVSIMKAERKSAARSLRLHAQRRRSSAKIEFPESRWLNVCSFLFALRQPFSAPAERGHELRQRVRPLTGGEFLLEIKRGIRRLRTAGACRAPRQGKRVDTKVSTLLTPTSFIS